MTRTFDRVRETMQSAVLPNSLRIYYIPKPAFSKTFAMLATNFGSVDSRFTMEDGTEIVTPAGVAHFLEHKMFEDEDGNALQKFGATGASPNAFTSHNMTAYYFSCTSGFEENLRILTKFVFTPYFTEENVAKRYAVLAVLCRHVSGVVPRTPGSYLDCGQRGQHCAHHARTSIPVPPRVLQPGKHGARRMWHGGL
ncbi:MAG: M16 family metallopeptidase [Butyricicoccus sp.]